MAKTELECAAGIWGLLGKKWVLPIVMSLSAKGTTRFNELHQGFDGISTKTLCDRLKELEDQGFVEREVFAEVPPRVEYSLSVKGKDLQRILSRLDDFCKRWSA